MRTINDLLSSNSYKKLLVEACWTAARAAVKEADESMKPQSCTPPNHVESKLKEALELLELRSALLSDMFPKPPAIQRFPEPPPAAVPAHPGVSLA